MKPSEELRAAAAKLRELAAAATPGPWFNHDGWLPQGGYVATVLSGEPGHGELRAWCPTWSNEPWDQARNSWNDAAWMACMSPDIAPGLADVLEHHAACINWANTWDDGLTHGETVKRLARSIIGEAE